VNKTPKDLLTWHEEAWQRLVSVRLADRLSHAYLIAGPAGGGKRHFAQALAYGVLCERPAQNGQACGSCRSCELLASGNHPDFLQITPESGKTQIHIDQIRELTENLTLASHRGGGRVAMIYPAHAVNIQAANSLLKTLEEPAPGTLLLLVSDLPGRLPATLRSRCQKILLPLPTTMSALMWLSQHSQAPTPTVERALDLAAGAPLLALDFLCDDLMDWESRLEASLLGIVQSERDPCREAAVWEAEDLSARLHWLRWLISSMIKWRAGWPVGRVPFIELLHEAMKSYEEEHLHRYLDLLGQLAVDKNGSLNKRMLIESALIPWRYRLSPMYLRFAG